MKFKKYRVKKEHIYPKRIDANWEINEVFDKGYVFYQHKHGDYYMLNLKDYKNKPSILESIMVEICVVEA